MTSPPRAKFVDRLTLLAVLCVVVLVSLPRLRSFGLYDNEAEALKTLVGLGPVVQAAQSAGTQAPLLDLAQENALLGAGLRGARQLDPALGEGTQAGGSRFLLHGYVFQWCADGEQAVLFAWPWHVGSTGRGVFAWTADGRLYGHPNRGGLWTGLEDAPLWRPRARAAPAQPALSEILPPAPENALAPIGQSGGWRRLELPADY